MKIYYGRELRVNYGPYEGQVITGGVSVDQHDLGVSLEDLQEMSTEEREEHFEELRAAAKRGLAQLQLDDIKASTTHAVSSSFVHDMFEDPHEDRPPARRSRTKRKR